MLRAIVLSVFLTGCTPWAIGGSMWNEDSTICPDSDYDNGGTLEPKPGYCKSGLGGFISLERNF